jgi:hypothetical protein
MGRYNGGKYITSGNWEQLKDDEALETASKRLGHIQDAVDKVRELREQSPLVKPDAEALINMLGEVINYLYDSFIDPEDAETVTRDTHDPDAPVVKE